MSLDVGLISKFTALNKSTCKVLLYCKNILIYGYIELQNNNKFYNSVATFSP